MKFANLGVRWITYAALLLLVAPGTGCKKEGVDPGKKGHDDHAGESHENDEIKLSAEEEKRGGIQTAKVAAGRIVHSIQLPARVTVDENTVVHVNPPIGGIVRRTNKKLGERVAKGDILVELDSVEIGKLASEAVKAMSETEAARTVLASETKLFDERLETQERLADAAIAVAQQIFDREKETFEKGLSVVRPYLEAEKELKTARLSRDAALMTLKAERSTRLLALSTELAAAEIDLQGARDRLHAVGLGETEIAALKSDAHTTLGRLVLTAPGDGILVARHSTIGEYVDPQTTLAKIQDLSRLWIIVSVNEKELSKVSIGQAAEVCVDAFPGVSIAGKVAFIGFEVSQETRSVDVRIEFENGRLAGWNEDFPLRPGMFGTARLVVADRDAPLVVPESALVTVEENSGVFVRDADGGFAFRPLRIAEVGDGVVEVEAGLAAGEEIAIAGTFVLKSMLNKSAMAHSHDH